MQPFQIKIKGIVAPSQWDKDGKVLQTRIMTFNEDQFEVADTELGRSLLLHIRKTVTAAGEMQSIGSEKQIRIHKLTFHDETSSGLEPHQNKPRTGPEQSF